jgi:DNA-binding LacI/PurR family transcriptional regulator
MKVTMATNDGQLTGLDRSRIAVLAFCSERTVTRYYDGAPVSESTRRRIEVALRKLGLARPKAAS